MDVSHSSSGLAAIPSWWLIVGLVVLIVTGLAPRAVAGSSNALLRGVAFLFGLPAAGLAQLSAACRSLLDRSLAWEEERLGLPQRTFAALMVCTRLLLGLVSCVVIVATGYQDMESLAPILLGPDAPPVTLPVQLNLGLIQGGLTFAILSLIGMLLLEVLNPAHANLALFPNPKPAFQRVLLVTAVGGSCLSLVMVTVIFVDRELMAQGYTWPLAGILISACLGILSNVCSMIGFWAAVLGLMALFSTLMTLLYLLVRLLGAPFELLRDLFTWIVHAQLVEHLVNLLGAPVRGLANAFLDSALGRSLRLRTVPSVFDPAIGDRSVVTVAEDYGGAGGRWPAPRPQTIVSPADERDEDDVRVDGKRARSKASLVFVDAFGYGLMEPLGDALVRLGGGRGQLVRATGYVPLTRLPDGSARRLARKLGAHDVTSTPAQVERAHRTGESRVRL